ncbi:MAG: aminopeptidase [Bacteroidota bacterium]
MQKVKFILLLFGFYIPVYAQTNEISIHAKLEPKSQEIEIQQKIVYHNNSNQVLDTIYFHNWANAYKDRKTPLSKRLIENYDKSLYFAKSEKRGYCEIKDIAIDSSSVNWKEDAEAIDIVKAAVSGGLAPKDSVIINFRFKVKVPSDRFTKYGVSENNFNLKYWYISPAVFDKKWQIMSNLDLDDLYINPSNYNIEFEVPRGFALHSDLHQEIELKENFALYKLKGKNRSDIEINIELLNSFSSYQTDSLEVVSNIDNVNLDSKIKTDVLNRQLDFIKNYLGEYPHDKLMVNKITYQKNPAYGFNQLPKKMGPFSDVFEWDIKIFKALTKKFIDNTLFLNRRSDYWLTDGIQIYLMMEYVSKYYPEVKAIGKISKKWWIKNYNIAKLDFNGKYPFVYQFAARKNLDQSLITRSDSLSNFNRKIVNKYKAGLGLRFMDSYLNDSIVIKSLQEFYRENALKLTSCKSFRSTVKNKTDKDLSGFWGDYLRTAKKIDYTINEITKEGDSLKVEIENKRDFTSPVALYGVKDKEIKYKKWFDHIDSTKVVTIPQNGFDRVSLNYEYLYPEVNLRNNWKKVDQKVLNRPLKFTFFKDIEDPYYNQIFYNVYSEYNYYEGIVLGPELYNQAMFKKKWLYNITPQFGLKSKTLNGSLSVLYQHLPENSKVYRYSAGVSASKSLYDKELEYYKFYPFFLMQFHRKTLRDVGGSSLMARYNMVYKEVPEGEVRQEADRYNVFNIKYGYSQPNIINDLRYYFDFQLSDKFSKASVDFRYRILTDRHRQFDFRAYFGTFLYNNTESDFFSFALDRPSDYMFDYGYMGRSEETGFFSQEIIISEGGFKSIFENKFANRWIASTNMSMSIWRWLEVYGDAGVVKNSGHDPRFYYDSGIRLNLIHDFVEIYFPLQSSLGFEPSLPDYETKIRFVFTMSPSKIYNFIRRGFY